MYYLFFFYQGPLVGTNRRVSRHSEVYASDALMISKWLDGVGRVAAIMQLSADLKILFN
jgi:hypothetical protein